MENPINNVTYIIAIFHKTLSYIQLSSYVWWQWLIGVPDFKVWFCTESPVCCNLVNSFYSFFFHFSFHLLVCLFIPPLFSPPSLFFHSFPPCHTLWPWHGEIDSQEASSIPFLCLGETEAVYYSGSGEGKESGSCVGELTFSTVLLQSSLRLALFPWCLVPACQKCLGLSEAMMPIPSTSKWIAGFP